LHKMRKRNKGKKALAIINATTQLKGKSIIHSESVYGKKSPIHKEQPDLYLDVTPSWLFRFGDFEHEKWGLHKKECYEFLKRLSDFEKQTWREIRFADNGKNNHFIDIAEIIKEAKQRLTAIGLNDEDQLFSLRITGRKRLWGILRDGKYNILWYDREHEICPSLLKHT